MLQHSNLKQRSVSLVLWLLQYLQSNLSTKPGKTCQYNYYHMSKNVELSNAFLPKMIDAFDHLPKASFSQRAHNLIYKNNKKQQQPWGQHPWLVGWLVQHDSAGKHKTSVKKSEKNKCFIYIFLSGRLHCERRCDLCHQSQSSWIVFCSTSA